MKKCHSFPKAFNHSPSYRNFGRNGNNNNDKYKSFNSFKLLNIVDAMNSFLIIMNIVSFYLYGLKLGNFFVFALTVILYYSTKQNIQETILFMLGYPLAWLFLLPVKNEEIEEFFNVPIPSEITLKIDENILNVLPAKTILIIGNVSEKKKAVRTIVMYVTKGIDVEKNMKFLRLLMKDPHMDVALYANQGLEDIEEYYESKISKYLSQNTLYSCKLIYNYLKTGIPSGHVKSDFQKILMEKLEKVSDRLPLYYEIKYYLSQDPSFLLEGYQKTMSKGLLRLYIFEKLKKEEQ
ncbi:MAG: hypothetical protein ACK4MM_01445 [Fervidobacterium sp.]